MEIFVFTEKTLSRKRSGNSIKSSLDGIIIKVK